MSEHIEGEAPPSVSRRTVTKAMAWAVPVIALAAPVPAFAASQTILQGTGDACRLPGSSGSLFKGYVLGFTARNPFNVPIIVIIESIILNGTSLGNLQVINLDGCVKLGNNSFTVPANTVYSNLVVLTKEAGNSQAGTLTATYTIVGGPGGTVTASTAVDTVPPLQAGECTGFTPAEKDCIAQQSRVE